MARDVGIGFSPCCLRIHAHAMHAVPAQPESEVVQMEAATHYFAAFPGHPTSMALLGLTAADFRGTLLLRDCLEAQGAFLLVQLIKAALNEAGDGAMGLVPPPAARRVVLVAAQHAASHYAIVLRKAGLHVPDLLARGRLVVLDLLSMLGTGLLPLQVLHQQLAAAVAGGGVAGSGTGRGVCLVADDLSVSAGLATEGHGSSRCAACYAYAMLCLHDTMSLMLWRFRDKPVLTCASPAAGPALPGPW